VGRQPQPRLIAPGCWATHSACSRTGAAASFLFQPQLISISNKRLNGMWKDVPQFANDLPGWSWQ
jgi:hypothetical protein